MKPRITILVDAENVSSRYWPSIWSEVSSLGTITSTRLFGDFSSDRLANWLTIARDDCLEIAMQLSGGKNAADIALTVSAMDVLHQAKTEIVCLVSSDRDFAPLALRLRGAGIRVHGFGNANASTGLQKSCTTFTLLGGESGKNKAA